MSGAFDRRRSRYVPLDIHVAFDEFGSKLIQKWGMEGVCGWMLLLAAAKREVTQGLFTYTSDAEAWTKLGATASSYTLDEFFRFTGQCKKTRKTRQGRVTYVQIRGWDNWNTRTPSQQNPSKEQENTDEKREITGENDPITRLEGEGEGEGEEERKTPSTREETTVRTDAPLRCCAPVKNAEQRHGPDRPCRLTFRNERELRSHLSVVHWLEDDEIAAALAQPRLAVVEAAS